jgi:hypothetical protein
VGKSTIGVWGGCGKSSGVRKIGMQPDARRRTTTVQNRAR